MKENRQNEIERQRKRETGRMKERKWIERQKESKTKKDRKKRQKH